MRVLLPWNKRRDPDDSSSYSDQEILLEDDASIQTESSSSDAQSSNRSSFSLVGSSSLKQAPSVPKFIAAKQAAPRLDDPSANDAETTRSVRGNDPESPSSSLKASSSHCPFVETVHQEQESEKLSIPVAAAVNPEHVITPPSPTRVPESKHNKTKKRPRSPDSKPPAKPTNMTGGGRIQRRRTEEGVRSSDDPAWEEEDSFDEQEPLENEPPVFENRSTTIRILPSRQPEETKTDKEHRDDETQDDQKTSSVSPATGAFLEDLKKRGLEIVEQEGDGNCLFRAVSLQVYGDPSMHGEVRERCLDFMERDTEHFSPFVVLDEATGGNSTNTKDSFAAYIARKRQLGVHGNNPEIQAISELFNRPVEVYTPERGATPLNIFQTAYKTSDVPIRLSYHDGNHYNAVIDPLVPTAGLGLGLPGLQPGLADKMQMAKAVAESDQMADEKELEQVLKASEEDELRRVIQESTVSVNKMYDGKVLAVSDLDATNFELEQKVLANSLESFRRQEHGRKQRALPSGRQRMQPSPVFPIYSESDSSVAAAAASSAGVASLPSVASAAVASAASAPSSSPIDDAPFLGSADEYPATVQELVMNGFELRKVVHAYELIGDNFDDLLAFLISNSS